MTELDYLVIPESRSDVDSMIDDMHLINPNIQILLS